MMLRLVLCLTLAFLPACQTRSASADLPASDLEAFQANMERTLAKRKLANGKLYCAEDARNVEKLADCAGDVEDTLYKSEADKARGIEQVRTFVKRMLLQRAPCSRWDRLTRNPRCKVD